MQPRTLLILVLICLCSSLVQAAPLKTGLLLRDRDFDPASQPIGREAQAAWAWVQKNAEHPVLLKLNPETGPIEVATGKPIDLKTVGVLWLHHGDDVLRRTKLIGPELKGWVSSGGGLFLSGGALQMLSPFGREGYSGHMQAYTRLPFRQRIDAGFVPFEKNHPIFAGLKVSEDGLVYTSQGGPTAVSDFSSGGPIHAMVLGKTATGDENPIAEFTYGSGRIIVLGWDLPEYADLNNKYRGNLTRLTKNILDYLAKDPKDQFPFEVRSAFKYRKLPPAGTPVPERLRPIEKDFAALSAAIDDLEKTFAEKYPKAADYRKELAALKSQIISTKTGESDKGSQDLAVRRFYAMQREALLANPLLDFDRLIYIRRKGHMGLPANYYSNSSLPQKGYNNQLLVRSIHRPDEKPTALFQPDDGRFVGDIDLHFDADKMLVSVSNIDGRWRIGELAGIEESIKSGKKLSLDILPLLNEPDVDNYDSCYLPDGRIIFTSTAPFTGVPCVGGRSHVTNLYLWDKNSPMIRRLTFDQEHNWSPRVMSNGRILYQRWEYTDLVHVYYRLLFTMNPDGTNQAEFYGSNSYWPTSMFYAREVPGHPTMVATIVGGHHDYPRMGELVLLDASKGRFETEGVVARIGGTEPKVRAKVQDSLVTGIWPKFLHPWPLSDKYLIASCKPTPGAPWGIYLVDTFGNYLLLHDEPGAMIFEPIPLASRPKPPVVPDRIDPTKKEAEVYMADIYIGPGLKGIPRGTVKALRIVSYQFAYHEMGGEPDRVGIDGPWDVKRIIGTVPVEPDGSARFKVPAYLPISLQPLDAEGKSIQLVRSWFTAMPGEVVSCVGCHEAQNSTPPARATIAAKLNPRKIEPWYGPARGFSFKREVQPVLDKFCIGCHDGKQQADGQKLLDFTAREPIQTPGMLSGYNARFTPSYIALRSYVRNYTVECDVHLLNPLEYHADTSPLIRMLGNGHHGVELDQEAWDRLVTWIDLNAPAHGTWWEVCGWNKPDAVKKYSKRRREMHLKTTGIDLDEEAVFDLVKKSEPIVPKSWDKTKASQPVAKAEPKPLTAPIVKPVEKLAKKSVELGDQVKLNMVQLPAADKNGPIWVGQYEVTNEQFARFDPNHDSRFEVGDWEKFSPVHLGYTANRPSQPVVRVSRDQAEAFCSWLSEKTGKKFRLPTDAEWDYACRAGSDTPLWYGGLDTDFSKTANLADAMLKRLDYDHVPGCIPEWRLAEERVDDNYRIAAPVGTYSPNRWSLFDMHGNVAEWTSTEKDSRAAVVGGSFYDRPKEAVVGFRRYHHPYQPLFDVGFRVVLEEN
jgi:hydrazine synthase alpha subunit-like protein/sulfatase-modifying factor enzyme 1